MKLLIINADDFGLHESINHGIIEGHTKGCITSTSIMPGGPAFEQAAALAAGHPRLGVGVHLTLVGGQPVSDPGKIASLVDNDGLFWASYPAFLKKLCAADVQLADIRYELTAQVQQVLAAGIPVTHLDSHQHMHVVPGIIDIVLDIARQYSIPAMRIPAEPLLFWGGFSATAGRDIGRTGLSILAEMARQKARRAGLFVPGHFYGMLAGGSMDERLLLRIITGLPDGLAEIMIHPGQSDAILSQTFAWGYHWQQELAAVTSRQVAACLKERHIELVSFARINKE